MKSLSPILFSVTAQGARAAPRAAYRRVGASELALREAWFRDAIFDDPELVVGACREAGRVSPEEVWLPWATEYNFGAGPVDVLLLSSRGRIAIVETKLSHNPQKRREVVAQILDYALALQETSEDDLPELPESDDAPDWADLQECLTQGNFLLIVAGDALDPRALRLSQAMLAAHLTTGWDLAMIDLNLYRADDAPAPLLLVPELRGMLVAETRQVVRVAVEGETARTRVTVEHVTDDSGSRARRGKLASIDAFLGGLRGHAPAVHSAIRRIVERFEQRAAASDGRFVLGLESATANLYLRTESGRLRRILAMRQDGRFRVLLRYLREEGREDLIAKLCELAKPIVPISTTDNSGGVVVTERNLEAILSVIDSAVDSLE